MRLRVDTQVMACNYFCRDVIKLRFFDVLPSDKLLSEPRDFHKPLAMAYKE